MAALTLKHIPDDLLRDLRDAAEADRRSLNQEVIHLLEMALRRLAEGGDRKAEIRAQVAAWRRLAGRWQSNLDPATEANQLMRRRTTGRKVSL